MADGAGRDERGRWRPGVSGNPSGPRPGCGPGALLRQAIAAKAPEILSAMIARALEGDVSAARLPLERICAPLRATDEPASVPLTDGAPLAEQGRHVLHAMGEGSLTPGQAGEMMAALAMLVKLRVVDDLEARLRRLKERNGIDARYADAAPGAA
jgi:hypothetical protein